MMREIDITMLDCLWFLKVRCPSSCSTQILWVQQSHSKTTQSFHRCFAIVKRLTWKPASSHSNIKYSAMVCVFFKTCSLKGEETFAWSISVSLTSNFLFRLGKETIPPALYWENNVSEALCMCMRVLLGPTYYLCYANLAFSMTRITLWLDKK